MAEAGELACCSMKKAFSSMVFIVRELQPSSSDPYLNTDAGTMSPFEHGEVYVLDDGGEVNLDLSNYERFLDIKLTRDNNITTGKIYQVLDHSFFLFLSNEGEWMRDSPQFPFIWSYFFQPRFTFLSTPIYGAVEGKKLSFSPLFSLGTTAGLQQGAHPPPFGSLAVKWNVIIVGEER